MVQKWMFAFAVQILKTVRLCRTPRCFGLGMYANKLLGAQCDSSLRRFYLFILKLFACVLLHLHFKLPETYKQTEVGGR